MAAEQDFNVFQSMGIPEHYHHVAGSLLVAAVLTAVGLKVKSRLSKNSDDQILPEPKITLVNIAAAIAELWKGLLDSVVGHGSERFVPYIGATFIFILLNNLLGLVPGFTPPTENINTDFAMAITAFLIYQILGFREHGIGYLKQFTGGLPPKGYSTGLTYFLSCVAAGIVAIEVIGHSIRPISLSLRLWGNINGDHTLVGVFGGIVPLGVPVIFMALGVFVSVVQALVFSLLSTVYIKLAVSHDH